jgi:hypothetical protein
MRTPDRNICGKTRKSDPIPATFGSRTKLMKHMPTAPPAKQRIGERSKRRTISTPPSGMRSSKATAKTPTSWKRLVMLDPL